MSQGTQTTNQSTHIPNWPARVAHESDPNNREILAYLSGKEDGKTEEAEKVHRLFLANLELCCYYSAKFFNFLTKEKGIACELATIKAESISTFCSLFLIPFDIYESKEIRTALFDEANSFRKALKLKDVCLEFSILPITEPIDRSEIYNDGFIWEYNTDEKTSTNS